MKHNSRIGVIGGNGMLGSHLIKFLSNKGFNAVNLSKPLFNLTEAHHIIDTIPQFDCVVNCGAYTNVDKAETEQFLAKQVNCLSMKYLGMITNQHKIPLVHISTDYVFDGEDGNYNELSPTNPINVYGKTKLDGEKLLMENNPDAMILRVQWTYGDNGNHFIKKIIANCEKNHTIKVVDDQIGSPTSVECVSRAIQAMITNPCGGIYHYRSLNSCSRYDVACFIKNILSLDNEIIPCKTSDFILPAKRPLNTTLNCQKFFNTFTACSENWEYGIRKHLKGE